MSTLRPRIRLPFDPQLTGRSPVVEVTGYTLAARPGVRIDALVATPDAASGVLVHFPGFNTALGPWEAARSSWLARASGRQVVEVELPGMSRHGDPLPRAVRAELLRGSCVAWAELTLDYVRDAIARSCAEPAAGIEVLGFSTGCSLATAALPGLADLGPVGRLVLVEPVALSRRSVASLEADNLLDAGRMPFALATNRGHAEVMAARRAQSRQPSVHYGFADLIAIATMLSGDELGRDIAELRVPVGSCAIARGAHSALCRRAGFDALDATLSRVGIGGPTITVEGHGHQLWHSFPAFIGLVGQLWPERE